MKGLFTVNARSDKKLVSNTTYVSKQDAKVVRNQRNTDAGWFPTIGSGDEEKPNPAPMPFYIAKGPDHWLYNK